MSATSELLYHCGVAVNMKYTDSSSEAYAYHAEYAMENYFGFETSGLKWESGYSSSIWINMLKSDIDDERPIFYAALDTAAEGGHAWVIDGYNSNNEFHCNWGWTGTYNDWYYLTDLTPGITHNYNTSHHAILGAEPILDACSGLDGSSLACYPTNYSYSVTIPGSASVEWSKSSNLQQVGGNINPTYTVKAASSSVSGSGTITATIKNSHEQIFLTRVKNVWVGKPSFSGIELGVLCSNPPHEDVCIDQIVPVGVVDTNAVAQGVTGYHWLFGSWDQYVMGYENTGVYTDAVALLMLDDYAPEMQIVGVSAINTCGIGSPQSKTFYAVDCGGGWYMSMYPNPASGYVTVSFVVTDEVRSEEGKVMIEDKDYRDKELKEYTIEIWDEKRGVVKRVTPNEKYLQIPVNDLAPGRYYFHLIYNGQTYKQQLIVE